MGDYVKAQISALRKWNKPVGWLRARWQGSPREGIPDVRRRSRLHPDVVPERY